MKKLERFGKILMISMKTYLKQIMKNGMII